MVECLARHSGREVGHQRHPKNLGALRAGGDGLVNGGHPDQIGTQSAQHPDLGRRLVVRAGHRRIDPLGERRVDGARQRTQSGRIGVDQINELRTCQGRAGGEVQVVADQHRLTHGKLRTQAAGRIGQHDDVRPGRTSRTHRVHHGRQGVPLVGVDAPHQHQHPMVAQWHREQLPAVAVRAGGQKSGHVRHR